MNTQDLLNETLSIEGVVFVLGKISLIAAVGFAYTMGINFSSARSQRLPEIEVGGAEESQGKVSTNLSDYTIISARNIFGAGKTGPAAEKKPEVASDLKMRLVGTSISSIGSKVAIIEDTQKKTQDAFDLNETVFGQAKLVEVLPDAVKLDRSGKIEVLKLEDNPDPGSTTADAGGVQPLNPDQTQFSVPEAELEDALANLPRLLSQARAVPYFRNGKSVGMRLFAIRRDSLYEKLGLKNGDIVKAVNSNSLSDPTQALKLFEQLKSERNIGVKVERGGQDVDLSYSIN